MELDNNPPCDGMWKVRVGLKVLNTRFGGTELVTLGAEAALDGLLDGTDDGPVLQLAGVVVEVLPSEDIEARRSIMGMMCVELSGGDGL
jgi:hypothetical protein